MIVGALNTARIILYRSCQSSELPDELAARSCCWFRTASYCLSTVWWYVRTSAVFHTYSYTLFIRHKMANSVSDRQEFSMTSR